MNTRIKVLQATSKTGEIAVNSMAHFNAKTDKEYPPYIMEYQYLHFNRPRYNPMEDDSRVDYAIKAVKRAVWYYKSFKNNPKSVAFDPYRANKKEVEYFTLELACKNLGQAFHAVQDYVAHGQIGIEHRIADHSVRANTYWLFDSVMKTWRNADEVDFKWTDDTMGALKKEPGVIAKGKNANYETKSTRYRDTAVLTGLIFVMFKLNLPVEYRSDFY